MSAAVVDLRGEVVATVGAVADEDTVRIIREALARALRGEVQSVVFIGVGVSRQTSKTVNHRLDELERIANRSADVIVRLAALDEWRRQTEFRLSKVEDRKPRLTSQ